MIVVDKIFFTLIGTVFVNVNIDLFMLNYSYKVDDRRQVLPNYDNYY